MAEAAISLHEVSKRFRLPSSRRQSFKERAVRGKAEDTYFWALRDATFDIPRGSTFGVIGPNGSGKSTALKVMAGIYRPTHGQVHVRGSLSALLELGAGFHPELSGRENITLNASILGMSQSQIAAATDEIIEFADLGEHIEAPVKVYSSGMYVRLGFAIAVTVQSDILIVDEVIAVGDEQFQRKCFDHIHSLWRKGATVVLVSHGLELIETLCDEAVWMDKGQVQGIGGGREVVRRYVDSINAVQPHIDQRTGLRHTGTGEALITSVTFAGEDGGPVVSGRPFEVVIRYESSAHLAEVVLGLTIVHEPGIKLGGPNTADAGLVELGLGIGEARFSGLSMALMPGRYVVSAGIMQPGRRVIDQVYDAFDLEVLPSGDFVHGLVRMEGTWQVDQVPAADA